MTGADNVPWNGAAHLQPGEAAITIRRSSRLTNGSVAFPEAHTCSRVLDLPQYNSKEELRSRLLEAIATTGFGFA